MLKSLNGSSYYLLTIKDYQYICKVFEYDNMMFVDVKTSTIKRYFQVAIYNYRDNKDIVIEVNIEYNDDFVAHLDYLQERLYRESLINNKIIERLERSF